MCLLRWLVGLLSVFVDMGPRGSKNVKSLLLSQFSSDFNQTYDIHCTCILYGKERILFITFLGYLHGTLKLS